MEDIHVKQNYPSFKKTGQYVSKFSNSLTHKVENQQMFTFCPNTAFMCLTASYDVQPLFPSTGVTDWFL